MKYVSIFVVLILPAAIGAVSRGAPPPSTAPAAHVTPWVSDDHADDFGPFARPDTSWDFRLRTDLKRHRLTTWVSGRGDDDWFLLAEDVPLVGTAQAIVRVPGVDQLHVGMRDLALRIGREVTDYNAHLSVRDELDHVVQVCQKTGRAAAVIVSSAGELLLRVQDGYRLICAGADLNFAEEGCRAMREALAGRSSPAQP